VQSADDHFGQYYARHSIGYSLGLYRITERYENTGPNLRVADPIPPFRISDPDMIIVVCSQNLFLHV